MVGVFMRNSTIFSWSDIPATTEALLIYNESVYSENRMLVESGEISVYYGAMSIYMSLCGYANKVLDKRVIEYLTYQF